MSGAIEDVSMACGRASSWFRLNGGWSTGGIHSFLQQCSDFTHMRSALIGRTARICADLWMSDMLW